MQSWRMMRVNRQAKIIIFASVATFLILCVFVGGLGYLQNKRFEAHLQANNETLKELQNYKESLILTAKAFKIRNAELKEKLAECQKGGIE